MTSDSKDLEETLGENLKLRRELKSKVDKARGGSGTVYWSFLQQWRGEQPLWKAFWLYFFAGSFLASTLGLVLAAAVQFAVENVIVGQPIDVITALLVYAPFSLLAPGAYQAFSGIGAWRSASWHHLTGILARAYIALFFAVLLFLLGSLLYALFTGQVALFTGTFSLLSKGPPQNLS